jgi:hypothetical protein
MGSAKPDFSGPVEKCWRRRGECRQPVLVAAASRERWRMRHEGFGITIEDAIEALRIAFEEDLLSYLDLDHC